MNFCLTREVAIMIIILLSDKDLFPLCSAVCLALRRLRISGCGKRCSTPEPADSQCTTAATQPRGASSAWTQVEEQG